MRNISHLIKLEQPDKVADPITALDKVEEVFATASEVNSLQWYTDTIDVLTCVHDALTEAGELNLGLNSFIGEPVCETHPVFSTAYCEKTVESIGESIKNGIMKVLQFIQRMLRKISRFMRDVLYAILSMFNVLTTHRLKVDYDMVTIGNLAYKLGLQTADVPFNTIPMDSAELKRVLGKLEDAEKVELPGTPVKTHMSGPKSVYNDYVHKETHHFNRKIETLGFVFPKEYAANILDTAKKFHGKDVVFLPIDKVVKYYRGLLRKASSDVMNRYIVYSNKAHISVPPYVVNDDNPLNSYVFMLHDAIIDMLSLSDGLHKNLDVTSFLEWVEQHNEILSKYTTKNVMQSTTNVDPVFKNVANNVVVNIIPPNANIQVIVDAFIHTDTTIKMYKETITERTAKSLYYLSDTLFVVVSSINKQLKTITDEQLLSSTSKAVNKLATFIPMVMILIDHIATANKDITIVSKAIESGYMAKSRSSKK